VSSPPPQDQDDADNWNNVSLDDSYEMFAPGAGRPSVVAFNAMFGVGDSDSADTAAAIPRPPLTGPTKPVRQATFQFRDLSKTKLLSHIVSTAACSRFTQLAVSSKGKKKQFGAYGAFYLQHADYDYERAQAHLEGIQNTLKVMKDESLARVSKSYITPQHATPLPKTSSISPWLASARFPQLDPFNPRQKRLGKMRLITSMSDVITGPQRRRSHTLCSYCEQYIPRRNYHDHRNCPKRETAMEGELIVRLKIRLGFSNQTLHILRMGLGPDVVATYANFVEHRDRLYGQTPPLLLAPDNRSVWSPIDDLVDWMLTPAPVFLKTQTSLLE
jgi:hypothetical protein